MDYYHNLVTDKSWQILKNLKERFDFLLIGGWAVYLYTQRLKSKDIDLVVDFENLSKIKSELPTVKNEYLAKYEARDEEIQIDIYVPYYSNPGLPAEELFFYSTNVADFKTVSKEILALLKQKALNNRSQTIKGKKDLADLLSLWQLPDFNWAKFKQFVKKYKKMSELDFALKIIKSTRSFAELDLNEYAFSKLKKQLLSHFS